MSTDYYFVCHSCKMRDPYFSVSNGLGGTKMPTDMPYIKKFLYKHILCGVQHIGLAVEQGPVAEEYQQDPNLDLDNDGNFIRSRFHWE